MTSDVTGADPARNRFVTIQAVRWFGVAQVLLAIALLSGRVGWPQWIGYVLVVNGLVDVFVIPAVLARRWRSPKP